MTHIHARIHLDCLMKQRQAELNSIQREVRCVSFYKSSKISSTSNIPRTLQPAGTSN